MHNEMNSLFLDTMYRKPMFPNPFAKNTALFWCCNYGDTLEFRLDGTKINGESNP